MVSRPCVVSVEDDQGIFDLIQKTLATLPVHLHHARTGLEAVQMVVDLHPDLIVLDISLPDIHGWDVLKQVKMIPGIEPQILVLTARTEPAHRVIGHLQNVDCYLSKPFLPTELRNNVSSILGLA